MSKGQPRVLTLVVVRKDGNLLLGLKKRGFGKGLFNGFGGKLEPGETIEQAAYRELFEEAGITARSLDLRGIIDFEFTEEEFSPPLQVHIFLCVDFDGEPHESDEMAPQWFPESCLPYDRMWPDDSYWLPALLAGAYFSGWFMFDGPKTILHYRLTSSSEPVVHPSPQHNQLPSLSGRLQPSLMTGPTVSLLSLDHGLLVSVLLLLERPADLCAVASTCRRVRAVCQDESLWQALCGAWGARQLPPQLSSWREYFQHAYRCREVPLGCMSVYNASYVCTIEKLVFTPHHLALHIHERGDMSQGEIQDPRDSALLLRKASEGALDETQLIVPPSSYEFEVEDLRSTVRGAILFDIRYFVNCSGDVLSFRYGSSGYSTVQLFALTPAFSTAHHLDHLLPRQPHQDHPPLPPLSPMARLPQTNETLEYMADQMDMMLDTFHLMEHDL